MNKHLQKTLIKVKVLRTTGVVNSNGKYQILGLNWRNPLTWIVALVTAAGISLWRAVAAFYISMDELWSYRNNK